jgi:hypothetical protein
MLWLPVLRVLMLKVAVPFVRVAVPSGVVPSLKLTVPVGVLAFARAEVTVTVKVICWPKAEGVRDDEALVIVLSPEILTTNPSSTPLKVVCSAPGVVTKVEDSVVPVT